MNVGRERKISSGAYLGLPAWLVAASVLHAAACGGSASDGSGGTDTDGLAIAPPPVVIPSRAEPPAAPASGPSPPVEGPAAAEGGPPSGPPAPIRALLGDLPTQLDTAQFETLFDHYCVSCHRTPACAAGCDGTFFDSWDHLLAGGIGGAGSAERLLERTVQRMSEGSMPPPDLDPEIYRGIYDLPSNARDRMLEFILDALGGR
jgi:hypothetical protein